MQLSKSDYMLYLKHPGWLWLKKHDKSKLPATDDALQAIFDDGHLFEEYAEALFPQAVKVGFSGYHEYVTMPHRTRQVMEKGSTTILQGRFESGNITCIVDVIEKNGDGSYDLCEIKSSTEVKDDHIHDLAFQTLVLEGAGIRVGKITVVHVNRAYVRKGEIDISEFAMREDVTEQVRAKLDDTQVTIEKALTVASSKTPPDFSPRYAGQGALAEWMAIYEILYPHTHPHSIYKLTRVHPTLIGELEDLGVKLIGDIPDSVKLNEKQKLQVKVTRESVRHIQTENIRSFLDGLVYPLYFFDYETSSSVVPPFDGLHPYQQLPFQYSLHILTKEGVLSHKEYLHTERSHPGLPLLTQLVADIGTRGSVIVWYEPFEKGRNTELGQLFPEYASALEEINGRIVDLMKPFSEGWFADKDFFGSASIKKVLPVLVSELSYKKLDIQEGATASRLWTETILEGQHAEEKEKIMANLREYCKLDTYAMVEVMRKIKSSSKQ